MRQLQSLQKEMLEVTIPAIEKAREFSNNEENDEMMHAQQDQSKYQNRIAELERMINNSDVIDNIDFTGVVDYGTDVFILNTETQTKRWVRIVGEMEGTSRSEISFTSPFGQALLGHTVGDEIEVQSPGGIQYWEILEVKVSSAFSNISNEQSQGQV